MIDVSELRATMSGTVLTPADPGYDDARTIFNAMIEKRPAVIARCNNIDDVRAALAFGRTHDLEIGVRSGGHGVAGACLNDGGIVIDLRGLNAVEVDPIGKLAHAGGGTTWGEFDAATGAHGLATTGGRVSTTGVAGLTLGGGSGWLERRFGLAVDNLHEVELVTADGRVVIANASENTELFWGVRGGGGNFGIVTRFTFRVHPLSTVYIALVLWTPDKAREVTQRFREFIANDTASVGGGVLFLTAPPEDFVPSEFVGQRACGMLLVIPGPEAEGAAIAAPLMDFLDPITAIGMEIPYAGLNSMLDDPPGYRNYWSAEHLTDLSDAAIDAFVRAGEQIPSPTPTQLAMFPWGGAVAAHDDGSTPITNRDATWVFHPLGLWENASDDAANIAWARAACQAMRPFATGNVYLNFIGDEGQDRVVAGYGKENYERLAELKRVWDPTNLFRGNQNIQPATTG